MSNNIIQWNWSSAIDRWNLECGEQCAKYKPKYENENNGKFKWPMNDNYNWIDQSTSNHIDGTSNPLSFIRVVACVCYYDYYFVNCYCIMSAYFHSVVFFFFLFSWFAVVIRYFNRLNVACLVFSVFKSNYETHTQSFWLCTALFDSIYLFGFRLFFLISLRSCMFFIHSIRCLLFGSLVLFPQSTSFLV